MTQKIRAAVSVRRSKDTMFIIARTDAVEPNGLDDALRRCELYLKAGADALYVEAEHDEKQLARVAREFHGEWLVANMLEGGGKTPWLPPERLRQMGYSMVLYPTTVLFQLTHAIEHALETLHSGRRMNPQMAVTMKQFEAIVDLPRWAVLEARFRTGPIAKVRSWLDKLAA